MGCFSSFNAPEGAHVIDILVCTEEVDELEFVLKIRPYTSLASVHLIQNTCILLGLQHHLPLVRSEWLIPEACAVEYLYAKNTALIYIM